MSLVMHYLIGWLAVNVLIVAALYLSRKVRARRLVRERRHYRTLRVTQDWRAWQDAQHRKCPPFRNVA